VNKNSLSTILRGDFTDEQMLKGSLWGVAAEVG